MSVVPCSFCPRLGVTKLACGSAGSGALFTPSVNGGLRFLGPARLQGVCGTGTPDASTESMRESNKRKCCGDAHSNPYIDNCMVCAPYWGDYPVCPDCNRKLKAGPGKYGPRGERIDKPKGRCVNEECVSYRKWFIFGGVAS